MYMHYYIYVCIYLYVKQAKGSSERYIVQHIKKILKALENTVGAHTHMPVFFLT